MKYKCFALIIGINDYEDNLKLDNAVNDAIEISEVFRHLMYDVKLLTDTSKEEFDNAFEDLLANAKNYNVIVIFFSGHGMNCNASDCIVFKDAKNMALHGGIIALQKSMSLERIYTQLNYVYDGITIMIIDACREKANSGYRGIGKIEPFGRNTVLPYQSFTAFSTSPGAVAKDGKNGHSEYTEALLEQLPIPNQTIETTFKNIRKKIYRDRTSQLSWEHSCLVDEFCFNHGQLQPHYTGPYALQCYSYKEFNSYYEFSLGDLHQVIQNFHTDQSRELLIKTLPTLSPDNQFVAGKLLIEECLHQSEFIHLLSSRFLERFSDGNENHVIDGFLYGFYVDLEDNARMGEKLPPELTELVSMLSNSSENKESVKFLKKELSIFGDKVIYICGSGDCRIKVNVRRHEQLYSSPKLLIMDSVIFEDKEIQVEVPVKEYFDKKHLILYLRKEFNIPLSSQKIISSPKIKNDSVIVTEPIDMTAILEDYIHSTGISEIDELGNHYELGSITDSDITDVYFSKEGLIVYGTFSVEATIYLDHEEEVRYENTFKGEFCVLLTLEDYGWKIADECSLKVDTNSFYL